MGEEEGSVREKLCGAARERGNNESDLLKVYGESFIVRGEAGVRGKMFSTPTTSDR